MHPTNLIGQDGRANADEGPWLDIGWIDPSIYQQVFANPLADWDSRWSRKHRQATPHANTWIMPLVWAPTDQTFEDDQEVGQATEFFGTYWHDGFFDQLGRSLSSYFGGGHWLRVNFGRLAPGKIHPHRDGGESAIANHRIHVPIRTDPDVIFEVDGATRHLASGSIVGFDNEQIHAVHNDAQTDRVHLVVDWFDSNRLAEA